MACAASVDAVREATGVRLRIGGDWTLASAGGLATAVERGAARTCPGTARAACCSAYFVAPTLSVLLMNAATLSCSSFSAGRCA